MARKIRAKLIMELREQGLSRRMIAKTRRMSMESVCEVFDIAAERNIGWGDVREMADDEVYRLFYPERHVRESAFEEPDWEYVHKEMARVGVNLRLLHDEYRERCRRTGKVAMGYTKFCGDYGGWTVANSLTKRIEHKAGQSCEVDWSGPTLGRGLVDPITGEVSKVYLFVGVLPFSQKAYFEPTPDMRERTWLRCHVHMYEFWGGVPERTVCDNLKTGVTKHPREGEIVLNDAYEALGEHYMTAINRAVYADKAMEDAGFLSQLDFRTPVREGDLYAIVFGDMVFTGLDPETGGSRDISPEERERVRERFGGAESIDSGASELLSVALAGRLRR